VSDPIAGVVFDAYGTLFDVYALEARLEALFPTKGRAISLRWRDKQIDYTRLRTLSGRYADFWAITADALDYACEFEQVALSTAARDELLGLYEHLPTHPEVPAALQALHARGLPLGVLSNGNETMLHKALVAAGIDGLFAHVLSVERVRKFKTAPEAYRLGPDAFGRLASELLFVSSNCWDVVGASWFGYSAYWVNRANAPPERLDCPPFVMGRTLDDLVVYFAAVSGPSV
jgi:2-haloacid dehalogenase